LLPILGTLAILLPVLAVARLSWAAAMDREARIETLAEARAFLERQRRLLPCVDSPAEYGRLLLETETVLLAEVSSWFARRANIGVA
jgi:hypothetical protein